jgi:hypothetical protein
LRAGCEARHSAFGRTALPSVCGALLEARPNKIPPSRLPVEIDEVTFLFLRLELGHFSALVQPEHSPVILPVEAPVSMATGVGQEGKLGASSKEQSLHKRGNKETVSPEQSASGARALQAKENALDEDEYTEQIEHLVETSYFPDLQRMHAALSHLTQPHESTPASANRNITALQPSQPSHAPSVTNSSGGHLDAFVDTHTGEDNASFAEVLNHQNERHRARLQSRGVSQPRSGLYSAPPGLPSPTPECAKHMQPRAIYPGNTRLHSPLDAMQQQQQHEQHVESAPSNGSNESRERSFVSTPSMSPSDVGGEPPITYGRVAQTPQRLDDNNNDDDIDFRVQTLSERERTGRRLAPKVQTAPVDSPARKKSSSSRKYSRRGSRTPASADRLSPAGKQLLKKIATPQRSVERGSASAAASRGTSAPSTPQRRRLMQDYNVGREWSQSPAPSPKQ